MHRKRFKKLVDESKKFESIPIRTRLSDQEVARFTVHRYRFPGVDIQARLFRHYPLGTVAAHVIGYIGRINQNEQDAIEEDGEEDNYVGTNYIGKEGLEKKYEKDLHGTTGYEEIEVSAGGQSIRTLSRNPATAGNNLILSIDIELQKIVEEAFGGVAEHSSRSTPRRATFSRTCRCQIMIPTSLSRASISRAGMR